MIRVRHQGGGGPLSLVPWKAAAAAATLPATRPADTPAADAMDPGGAHRLLLLFMRANVSKSGALDADEISEISWMPMLGGVATDLAAKLAAGMVRISAKVGLVDREQAARTGCLSRRWRASREFPTWPLGAQRRRWPSRSPHST